METARYWHGLDDETVQCDLCPHGCVLAEGATGRCRVRGTRGGRLAALAHGHVSSAGMDPIEKKPLYHYRPGSAIFSVGGWGCNLACSFCQNWSISQQVGQGDLLSPAQLVRAARQAGSTGIAYTYNEPLVGMEFVQDCARQALDAGLFNVLVTNGFVNPGPAGDLLPLVGALNIDVKSMDDAFYREHCKGRLDPVLAFAVQSHEAGCHVEITCLLIPGMNDSEAAIRRLAEWVSGALSPTTPLHLSAYRPMYKMRVAPTGVETLLRAHAICREQLAYVFLGNVLSDTGRDTICPACGAALIVRQGYATRVTGIEAGRCAGCGRAVDVVVD